MSTTTSFPASAEKRAAEALLKQQEAIKVQAKLIKQGVKRALKAPVVGADVVASNKKERQKRQKANLDQAREAEKNAEKEIRKAKETIRKTPYKYGALLLAMENQGLEVREDDFLDVKQKPLDRVRVFKAKPFIVNNNEVGVFEEVVLQYRAPSQTYYDPDEGGAATYTVAQLVRGRGSRYFSWLRAKNIGICRIKPDKDDVSVLNVHDCVKKSSGGGRKGKRKSSSKRKSLRFSQGPKKGRCRYGRRKKSGKCRSKATLRLTSGPRKGSCRYGKRKGSKKCRKRSKRRSRR